MKTCPVCKVEKNLDQFNKKADGLQSKCRACQREWYGNYYQSSPKEKDRLSKKKARQIHENRQLLKKLKNVPCMDCGQSYPSFVMDFDHRDPSKKKFSVGSAVRDHTLDAIMKEIEKCDVVCANCHRIRTYA